MAFIKYRGTTTSPTLPTQTTALNESLTNDDIDGNFASLDFYKLENNGFTSGDILYADSLGYIDNLPVGSDDKYLSVVGGLPSWEDAKVLSQSATPANNFNHPLLMTEVANSTRIATIGADITANPTTGVVYATDFDSTSDIRFKTDLVPIDNALEKVKTLTGYTFTMIQSGERSSGLIAQHVEAVLPEVVGGDENKKTLAYGAMMGLIVEAIKDLDEKLDEIKKQLENK